MSKKPIEELEYHYSYDDGDHLDGQPSHSYSRYFCPVCYSELNKHKDCENKECNTLIDWSEIK